LKDICLYTKDDKNIKLSYELDYHNEMYAERMCKEHRNLQRNNMYNNISYNLYDMIL